MAIRPNRKTLTTSALSSKLDAIWRRGDRDEVSTKHVAYTLAALIEGRKWNKQIDYQSMNEDKNVAERWCEIQSVRDNIGKKAFCTLVGSTKFAYLVNGLI